jgi:serine/threonine protein kinase
VVRVFDHGTTDDGPYIVMELLEGESLERRIKRAGPVALLELVAVIAQACKALAKAHERGIIHRDIKPGNIFLAQDDDLFVKVLDFGVAKFSGQEAIDMTATGNMVGTPAYMSPEQLFHGKSIDHRGDLWSLGVVAYHALTGERPFDGVTLGELCVSIKRGEFTPPSKLRNDVPPQIDAWFARAFAADLEARFRSAKEMATALETVVGVSSAMGSVPSLVASSPQLPTFAGTSVSTQPRLERSRRRYWVVGAVAASLLGIAGVAVVLSRGGGDAKQAAPAPTQSSVAQADRAKTAEAAATRPSAPASESTTASSSTSAAITPSAPSSTPAAGVDRRSPLSGPATVPPATKTTDAPQATTSKPETDERSKRAGEQLGI